MSKIIQYLKKLYSVKEDGFTREDLVAQLALIWVMNLFFIAPMASQMLITAVVSRIGVELITSMGAFAQFEMLVSGVGIPWLFVMLLACFFTLRYLFGTRMHFVFQLVGGYSIYMLHRLLLLMVLQLMGGADLLTSDAAVTAMISQGLGELIQLKIPFALFGLILIIWGFIKAKPKESDTKQEGFLTPKQYSRNIYLVSLSMFFLAVVLALILIYPMNSDVNNPAIPVISSLITLIVGILHLVWMVRRIRHSGYSPFIMGILLYCITLPLYGGGLIFLMQRQMLSGVAFSPLILGSAAQGLFTTAFGIANLFLIWLMVMPAQEENTP